MRKILVLATLVVSTFGIAQTNTDIKEEIDQIKIEISKLKTEINTVKSQNIYLKKTLNINQPILQLKENNNEYRITKVIGNSKEKTIGINFLIESLDANKKSNLDDFTLVDLNGNEYKINLYKSSSPYLKLTTKVPLNIHITFDNVNDEVKMIKLFKFRTENTLESDIFNSQFTKQEFRDLNVTWQ